MTMWSATSFVHVTVHGIADSFGQQTTHSNLLQTAQVMSAVF
jgi:hypothetical protein